MERNRVWQLPFFYLWAILWLPVYAQQPAAPATDETLFFEAEDFQTQGDGWKVQQNSQTQRASRGKALNGAVGDAQSTATQIVQIPKAGMWRIWVRSMSHDQFRGPFEMDILSGEKVVASRTFDVEFLAGTENWDYRWESFDAELSTSGEYTFRLRKYQNENVSGYTRNIDAVLLTQDMQQMPDHIPFGPQTWMKVTLGEGYEKPVHIHIFADHYRSPWYAHYAVSKDGVEDGLNPKRAEALLTDGETTGWVNISRTIYQDSGARLVMYPAFHYGMNAPHFNATVEFSVMPNDAEVVKKLEIDHSPSSIHIVMPPNLESAENIARLRIDREFSDEFGEIADRLEWPTIGKAPKRFPFFVSASIDPNTLDAGVLKRELKTLSYFGFNGVGSHREHEKFGFPHKTLPGVGWYMNGSYSAPDTERLRATAKLLHAEQTEAGIRPDQIDYAMVMDEPTGEPASKLAGDAASIEGFRVWLKSKNLTPQDLLVPSWDDVKPVVESERDHFPALHFFTQKYRTVALGKFLTLQKQLLHEQWQIDFPVVANFSDGAIYFGNFYGQGVDYFTLLHETEQNAIWSEDWSNLAATYQDATFNVELMRAAARKNGQWMGHHLIAYAGRTGTDVRLKAVSEVARGVKAFESFAYGPVWGTHEGSPWQKNVSIWKDHASVVREIGAVEDWLLSAKPQRAEVALLYSSASDVWNMGQNLASGFDRMHTWLAFTHAQIPIDVVHESDVEDGVLENYKIAYCSDPNLTRASAEKLRDWVQAGGTLILAAGAGQRDEFNRPLDTLDALLLFKRAAAQTLQAYHSSGQNLVTLNAQDTVSQGMVEIEVLSQKQAFENVPQDGVTIEATFADGSPASLKSAAGNGIIICRGYFPALDYMRQALIAKNGVQGRAKELNENNGIPGPDDVLPMKLHEKSYNPWQYPAAVRESILHPVRAAKVPAPIVCNVPLVDAVYMNAPQGILIPLANYTLQPIPSMTLEITIEKSVSEVRSVHAGLLPFERIGDKKIRVSMPLECTDFLTIQ